MRVKHDERKYREEWNSFYGHYPFFVSLVILYIIQKKGFCVVSSCKLSNVMKKQMIT